MSRVVFRLAAVTVAVISLVVSCTHEPFLVEDEGTVPVDPGCTTNGKVCFESNVLPIFQSSCARSGCHDATTREEDYVLDSYANIVKRGIKPGDANESKLYKGYKDLNEWIMNRKLEHKKAKSLRLRQ